MFRFPIFFQYLTDGTFHTNSFIARPARGTYSASKFAIEAMHESLSYEIKALDIKVLIVEPGVFGTPFTSRIITPAQFENGFSEGYQGTLVEQMVAGTQQMMSIPGFVEGDPDKAAREIVKATITDYDYLRLLLGKGCVIALEPKIGDLQRDLEVTRPIATATNVD